MAVYGTYARDLKERTRASPAASGGWRRRCWRASLAGVAGGRRWRSPTKRPAIPITGTKTPHSPIHRKQHTAHCEWRRLARSCAREQASTRRFHDNTTQSHPAAPAPRHPAGGSNPREGNQPRVNSPYPHRRRPTERREEETRRQKSPVSVIRQHPAGGSNPREGNQPRVNQI